MLKIYMLIIVVGLLGGVVYGAYAYYQDTQQRIATLQQNNAKLETVAKTNEMTINSLQESQEKFATLNKDLQMKLDKFQQFAALQKYGREFVRDMLTEAYKDTLKKSKYQFNENFLGWPTDESLGGYMIEQYLTEEYRISENDRHPNKKGQEKIAELIYDRLG